MRVQRPQINQDIDWDNFPPEHPVCEVQVEVPTLRLQQRGHGYPHRPPEFEGQEEIVVQWFGDNSRGNLKEKNLQFAFPLMTKLDSVHWFGRPEWYRTVMLGALKGWPNKEALTKMVEDGRSPDEVVIYVVTSQIGLDDGHGGTTPSALLVGVISLGDPIHGVISPREFANWEVPQEEIATLAQAMQRR
ncbi:hypothetical protein A3J11_00390 [Candidatus Kaiserbacteria bacterium RIFCSPLOWO2_02_FULL_55_12]|uniref:Uncharacterized protein n=2 Tax=Candidatus Kaiseribacteriota TaxID=1752734 RepID=A0A1F6EYY9_9BACT|nr:MAG: hypothetical protein A3C94_02850 [Candidatus Kaiserbacteria bacterium RIFCSPHIGHO2_02_FULL_55_17]OGG78837.1 MAG: hypothetical protein A3J11_00390 [Candidatus Kaiserbacteria bacterium RIFCSPLOWO2_02_FULL_55_12]